MDELDSFLYLFDVDIRLEAYPIEPPPNHWFWAYGIGHYQVGLDYFHENPNGYGGYYEMDKVYQHKTPNKYGGCHCVFLTVGGQGSYRWMNRQFKDEPNTLTIMNDVRGWMNWRTAKEPWDFYWLLFRGHGPVEWMRQFNVPLPLLAMPIDKECILDLVNDFNRLIKMMKVDSRGEQIAAQRDCFTLYNSLIEAAQTSAKTSDQLPAIYGKNLLEEIDRYLRRRDSEPDRLSELAKRVHASQEHVSRVLKATIGISPKEYFLRFRIKQAQQLLRETTLSIAEVGVEVGFPDPQHFSRLFHQRVGKSALAYRKTIGTKAE